MQLSRRDACRAAGGVVALGSAPALARAAADLRIVEVQLPSQIEQGGTFTAGVKIENVGDTEATREVSYKFEGDLIATMEITVGPGETRNATLPDMEFAWLEESGQRQIEPGVYTHSIGITDGPREAAEVEVVPSEGTPQQPPEGLRLVSSQLPEVLRRGRPIQVSITFENTRSTLITIDMSYAFEGVTVAEKDEVRIAAGETRTIEFEGITLAAIEDAGGRPLESGRYTHSIGVPEGGPRLDREVEVIASSDGSTATPSDGSTPDPSSERPLRITSVELPDEIREGEPFSVGMTVENTGEQPVERQPSYAFDGSRVLSGAPSEGLPIAAGSSEQFRYGDITLRMLEESVPGSIEPGEHEHSIGFPDGPRETASVVVTTGTGSGSDAARAEQQPVESGQGRERGFFSNSGDEPEALSNPFNLTTLGFLLSVAGIAHQLFQGR